MRYRHKASRLICSDRIGYASQQVKLFAGTVSENISYGDTEKTISQNSVERAVAISQSEEFLSCKEGGLEAQVAQGGTNFSGGQRQRLSIARAIAKKPEILIFDDSFSALDYKTDRAVRSTLKKDAKDITKLIVAQRIGTIRDADRIIVLEHGKAVGIGTHEELMKNCSVYREIAKSQLSDKELAGA